MSPLGQVPDNDGNGGQVEEEYPDETKINQNMSPCNHEDYNDGKHSSMEKSKSKNNIINETLTYKQRRTERKRNNRRQQRKSKNHQKMKSESHDIPRTLVQCQYSNEDTTWGDELVIYEGWKQQGDQHIFRVLQYNINGITAENDYLEGETILQSL